jgi:hypothetical protein
MNPYIIDSDSLDMNPQVDSFDSRGKRSIQGSKCSNSSPRARDSGETRCQNSRYPDECCYDTKYDGNPIIDGD